MRARAIIFDLDGTLVDTLEDIADSMNDALRLLAMPAHPIECYRQLVGDGAQRLAQRALPGWWCDTLTAEVLYDFYLRCYERRWRLKSRPYDGIASLLDACVAAGLKLAVLSNKADHFTRQVVLALLPDWEWAVLRGQLPRFPRKPAPDAALAIALEMGVAPEECLFLGDSAIDVECANAAGMYSIAALWGFRERAELEAASPRQIVHRPADVMAFLDACSPTSL
jgi:phosphoglycolate phosphatase